MQYFRELVAQYKPDLLPLIAYCPLIWTRRDEFSRLYELLKRWGKIQPETALILLGFKYPDTRIREFAVDSLDNVLDNDRLQLYILPLIQVEPLFKEYWAVFEFCRIFALRLHRGFLLMISVMILFPLTIV